MTSIRHCPFCGKVIDPSTNICDSCRDRINPNREKKEVKEEVIEVKEIPVEEKKVEKKVYKCPLCGRVMKTNMACCKRCKIKLKLSAVISLGIPIIYFISYILLFILFMFLLGNNKIIFDNTITGYLKIMIASFIASIILFIKAWKSAKNNQQSKLLNVYKIIVILHILVLVIVLLLEIL